MMQQGARRIVLGVGGTATVDGGASVLAGLGARFTRGDEAVEVHGARDALRAARLELPGGWDDIALECWCDVDTPLIGPRGAARTFAAQKGADGREVQALEQELEAWSAWLLSRGGVDPCLPSTGAGGGIPFGLAVLPRSLRRRGGPAVAERLGLHEQVENTDVLWTGEGRIDASTAAGKLVGTLLELARPLAKPVVAFAGLIEGEIDRILPGCEVVGLSPPGEDLSRGILEVEERLRQAARLTLGRYLDNRRRGRSSERLGGAS